MFFSYFCTKTWVLTRSASPRRAEIRKILVLFRRKKAPYLELWHFHYTLLPTHPPPPAYEVYREYIVFVFSITTVVCAFVCIFFVKDFSETTGPMILKFGTIVGYDLYCVRESQASGWIGSSGWIKCQNVLFSRKNKKNISI